MMNFVEWFSKTEAGQRYYFIFLSASYVINFLKFYDCNVLYFCLKGEESMTIVRQLL